MKIRRRDMYINLPEVDDAHLSPSLSLPLPATKTNASTKTVSPSDFFNDIPSSTLDSNDSY